MPPYTLPAAAINGETILDSLVIATKLEALFPSPSIHLDAPIITDIQAAVGRTFGNLFSIINPIPVLNESSVIYFIAKDAKDVAAYGPDPKGEAAWEAAKEPLRRLAGLIKGHFVLGEVVSYADFIVGGFLRHAWRVGGEEVLARIFVMDESGKVKGLYEGLEKLGLFNRYD